MDERSGTGPDAGAGGADHDVGANGGDGASEESGWASGARERMGRGFDRGRNAWSAFREALEETLSEARERGDLSTDRARDMLGRALDRARDATSDARERFDFVPQAEFDLLKRRVEALEARLGIAPEEGGAAGDREGAEEGGDG